MFLSRESGIYISGLYSVETETACPFMVVKGTRIGFFLPYGAAELWMRAWALTPSSALFSNPPIIAGD
jgi:uncharacterized protein YqjF (DUF2071 family)